MGKTSQKKKEKRLAGQVSLALAAGMFSALPVAHGMPTLDPAGTHKDYAETPSVVDNTMSVTGTGTNNVIDWKDFSVKAGETVAFQKVNDLPANYMNIVTGNATSNIEGRITNAGDVYLINPHGVIFGKGAKVDVGNLYVSTREANSVDITGFKGGTASGESVLSVAASPTTDVVNLIDSTTKGYVRAEKVVMEGRNIRFLDSSSVIQAGTGTVNETTGILTGGTANAASANLVLRSNNFDGTNGYIHVGDASGNYVYTTNKGVTGNTGNTGDAKKAKENLGVVNYALVRNAAGLNNINTNGGNANSGTGLSGNYMLANKITNAGSVQIGTGVVDDEENFSAGSSHAFTGKFDGMFYTVDGLAQTYGTTSVGSKYAGLFGYTRGARIENVGIENAKLNSEYAGGIVGYADGTTLLNVWNAGGTSANVGQSGWNAYVGGIAGSFVNNTTLKNAYNESVVNGAGLVGYLHNSHIQDAYNIGAVSAYSGFHYGIYYNIDSGTDNSSIKNVYTAAKYKHSGIVTGTEIFGTATSPSKVSGSYIISSSPGLAASNYGFFDISSEGATNTTWRIYEGASLPLLTSFMKAKGTVSTDYAYDKDGTVTAADSASYNPSSYWNKTYDATAVNPTSVAYFGMNADGTGISTSNNKNAGSFALFYGGQQGYDLYGNNFTINKREVLFSASDNPTFTKVYDGTTDATDAVADALSNASSGSTGFLEQDRQYLGDGKLGFSFNGVTATYGDKNVGEGKTVTITVDDGATITLTNNAATSDANYNTYETIRNNYTITGDLSSIASSETNQYTNGKISARPVLVSLKQTEGINKTYDGTAVVTDENKSATIDGLTTLAGTGNIKFSAIDGMEKSGFVSGEENSLALSATSQYVDTSGNATVNVSEANHVAYSNITAKETVGENEYQNYAFFYDDNGETKELGSDGADTALTAAGKINARELSVDDIALSFADESSTVTKTYNGTQTEDISGVTVAYTNTVSVEQAQAATPTLTGLMENDVGKISFASNGTATFYESDGTTKTSFATDYNGSGTGAQRAGYGITTTVTDAAMLTNYKWNDGTALTNGGFVDKLGSNGSGVINKRDITVAPRWDSGIDKVYDGDSNVKDVAGGNAYATGNYKITSGSLVADATTGSTPALGISGTPTYSDKNVEYDGTTPKAKSIAYTIALSGAAAGNYNLNNTGTTATTLNATGTITPKELTVTFGDVTKSYNTTADVTGITPNWDGLVTGDSANDTAISGKYVAKDAQGEYQNASDVGSYLNDGTKAVMYTGILNALGENAKNYKINGKHYTLSNTEYGRGYITARKISLEQLKSYLDPKGNLTKTYDATEKYTNDMVTANNLAASDYLQVDTTAVNTDIGAHTLMEGAATDIQAVINGKLTIAEAVYRNADGSNAVNASDTSYTNVSMTFNMDGTGKTKDTGDQKYYITVGNYDFEWAESFSDAASGTPATTGRMGTITPKGLTVTVANATKIYDGTTNVKANGVVFDASNDTFKSWFTFTGMMDNETVTLANGATATYDNENADAAGSTPAKRITYSGLALANGTGKASNYKIVDSQGATINSITGVGTINKRNVTLSDYGVAAATKTYDGDAEVEAYALTFADVTQEGATDKSVLAADHITDASGKIVSNLTGTYLPTGSQTQGQGKDVLRDSTNRTTILAKNVEYIDDPESDKTPLANLFGGNYNVTLANGGSYDSTTGKLTVTGGGKITPKKLYANDTEVVAGVANKIYDRTTDLENAAISYLTFSNSDLNTYKNDVLTVTGEYDSKDASENRTVTYTLTMKSGGVADNFDLDGDLFSATTGTATKIKTGNTIAKKIINAVIDPTVTAATQQETINKVYDGGMAVEAEDAETAKAWLKLDGVISGDTVSVDTSGNGFSITYKDKTVATSTVNDKVTYSGFGLKDTTDAGNYELASTTLSGYGTITPKDVNFNIAPVMNKYYDGGAGLSTAAQSGDAGEFAANSTTLAGAVTTWKNANIVADDDFDFSGLTGVYGSWSPSGTAGTFTENSHVNPTGGVPETKDVLYTFNVTGTDVGNYRLLNGSGATLKAEDNTITNTAYFHAAKETGQIYPLAISMSAVKNQWGTIGKVYDGNNLVASNGSQHVYDVNGVEITDPTKFLTIYYNKDGVDGYNPTSDIPIAYNIASAIYGNNNAGDQTVTYSGFTFSSQSLGDYLISGGDLDSTYNNASNPVTHTGTIARRLLVVDATSDPSNVNYRDHTKTYDGNEHSLLTYIKNENGDYVANPLAYTLAAQSLQNDNGTGRVGNDKVSVTYVANFNPTGTWDAAKDVNITDQATGTYTHKNVTYTFTLSGDDAANYTIVADKRTVGDGGTTAKATQQGVSAIKPREVYVDFATDNADVYQGEGLDKIYDGDSRLFKDADNSTSLLASGKSVNDILTLVSATNDTGIVAGEGLTLDTSNVTANYVDADGHASADSDVKLGITTRKVYIQNLNLTGTDNANNYVVKAVKKQGDTQDTNTLEGKGSVAQRQIDFATSTVPTKVYDGTTEVKVSSGGANVTYAGIKEGDADRQLQAGDVYIKLADGVTLAGTETLADVQVSVVSAFYSDRNADTSGGLGVTYKLKWDNQNYELLHTTVDQQGEKVRTLTGTGTITPRTLTYNTGDALTVNKTYDGTPDVKGTSVTSGIFAYAPVDANGKLTTDTGLIQGEDVRLDVIGSYKDDQGNPVSDTGAANNEINGANRTVEVNFEIIGNSNYVLGDSTGPITKNSDTTGTYNGTGRIDRALVKMTPNDATYYVGDAIPSSGYTGTVSGLQNNETLPNGYSFVSDGNAASSVGNYMLLGYVDGKTVAAGANEFTFVDGIGNYYFTTTPNTALHVNARASDVDNGLIADKKFTPDDYSYNRISKDQDLTRLNRESSASVQYAEKGVNLDGGDTKSGLSALADIQGAGSVVNLEGAFIRTSAPAEQPETVAAEAALPVPETEESDISSISLEYAGDGDNSQALLEILTNASSNAEKKGTSIVIDAQDEDKEDAEEEKSRRAIFADRSNIGIETLGDAVNLNQMIG